MKLLIVTPEYPPDHGGGISTYYRDLVPALRAEGCDVTVLKGSAYVHGDRSYELEGVSVQVLETPRFERWFKRLTHFEMFPQMRRHLAAAFALHEQAREGEGYDAVEVVDWGLQFLPWVVSSKVPFLVQLHGSDGQIAFHDPMIGREAEGSFSLLLERAGMAEAPIVSGISKLNSAWWASLLTREVNYTPPPFQALVPALTQHRKGWMSFGRIQFWKGPQVACEAWHRLGEKAPELHWYGRSIIHGETGDSTSDWLGHRYPRIWGHQVLHHHPVSPAEVSSLMARAKVVLIPSLWDTFNLVTAEAMAHECVVVVSDAAGAVDLVDHGINGFVFPAGDSEALASLVQEIESLPGERLRSIGRHAAETVSRVMAPAMIAKQKIELYRATTLPGGANHWLKQTLLPSDGRCSNASLRFLHQLPLSAITRHVLGRIKNKVTGIKKLDG